MIKTDDQPLVVANIQMVQRKLMMDMWGLVCICTPEFNICHRLSDKLSKFLKRNHCNQFWLSMDRANTDIRNRQLFRFSSSSQEAKANSQRKCHDRNSHHAFKIIKDGSLYKCNSVGSMLIWTRR